MNLFSELTVTDHISVSVRYHDDHVPGNILINNRATCDALVPIMSDIVITPVAAGIDGVIIDGIDITDHVFDLLSAHHVIHIPGPFYHWWHRVSGQGWLLHPYFPVDQKITLFI